MKIRVMIVEDEPPLARSLSRMIEAEHEAFEVVSLAIHGNEAMQVVRNQPIDVVFTDIRMPVMDGIELLGCLEREYPEVLKVAVSGFQEFEYARKAVQYNAVDFLLKPIARPELKALLAQIAAKLSVRTDASRRHQLNALLHEQAPLADARLWGHPVYALAVVCAGAFPLSPTEGMSAAAVWLDTILLEEMAEPLLAEQECCWELIGKTRTEKIVVLGLQDAARAPDLFGKLYDALVQPGGPCITMVVSEAAVRADEFWKRYAALRAHIYRHLIFGYSSLLTFADREEGQEITSKPLSFQIYASSADLLAREIVNGSSQRIHDSLCVLLDAMKQDQLTQLHVVQVLVWVTGRVQTLLGDRSPATNLELDVREAVTNASGYEDLKRELCPALENVNLHTAKDDVPEVVVAVERFLRQHYAEPITNDTLAKQFSFVPSYIGKLFRIHRGMSPYQYLIKTRIARAKELLSREPGKRMQEIAELVGFNDPLYFSRVFLKETGMRPTDYRPK